MDQVLIFGGLSDVGFPLSQHLLDCGVFTGSLSSAVTEEERKHEEDHELFLGRHALFCPERKVQSHTFTHLILADTLRLEQDKNELLKRRLNKLIANARDFRSILFLSSLDVQAASADALSGTPHPETESGKAANEMELFFVERLRQIKRKEALIFRIDLKMLSEQDSSKKMAHLIAGLMSENHTGLDVVCYQKRSDLHDPVNEKLRRLLPKSYWRWL
ncbi:hypothetical protein M3N64_03710 [Sporolactobacillus sp. CPB3-1]|uniref:Uncharacterized protein n=1 Tax=Sporolactobacillus mangiferae TaxID=2940498 RepID=A0ABT0M849_9BACL|nr:hypothetical protein [Sporolactobacillus mangiferae]MCL1631052.1 hypothetical protein [Sporolactobacillus mangiferae]